jgi:hypothetical protein
MTPARIHVTSTIKLRGSELDVGAGGLLDAVSGALRLPGSLTALSVFESLTESDG